MACSELGDVTMGIETEQQRKADEQNHTPTGPRHIPQHADAVVQLQGGGGKGGGADDKEDVRMTSADDDGDDEFLSRSELDYLSECGLVSDEEPLSPCEGDVWVKLYGFQGMVPFLLDDWETYKTAIRRLLSLPADADEAAYTLVHFDMVNAKLVEIDDDLAEDDSPAIDYLAGHFPDDDDLSQHRPDRCAFFVRLPNETSPTLWTPTDAQLGADVSRLRHACLDPLDTMSRGPPSCAYMAFPKTLGPQGSNVVDWDATQYVPCVQTAVEVLVGRPASHDPDHHHALFRLTAGTLSAPRTGPEASHCYGLATLRPSQLQAIRAVGVDLDLWYISLLAPQVNLVLPSFHPRTADGLFTSLDCVNELPRAIDQVRKIVSRFLGAREAGRVKSIRLLAGDTTLGSHANRRAATSLIPMSGDVPPFDAQRALAAVIDAAPRFIVLFPEYVHGTVSMHAAWDGDAEPDKPSVLLPRLGSTVAEFKDHVTQLCRVAGNDGNARVVYEPRLHRVSIRAVLPPESPHMSAESPTLFVDPKTTDEEWFSIRAQLTTRQAVVNVWPPLAWDWRQQIARSNLWGPRYGKASAVGNNKNSYNNTPWRPGASSRAPGVPPPHPGAPRGPAFSRGLAPLQRPAPSRGPAPSGPAPSQGLATSQEPGFCRGPAPGQSSAPSQWPASGRGPALSRGFAPSRGPAPSQNPATSQGLVTPEGSPGSSRGSKASIIDRGTSTTPSTQPMPHKAVAGDDPVSFLASETSLELQRVVAEDSRLACCSADRILVAHAREQNVAPRCLWCEETLYEWWSDEQKNAHLRERHRDKLMDALGIKRAAVHQHGGDGSGGEIVSIPLRRGRPTAAWTAQFSTPPPVDVGAGSGQGWLHPSSADAPSSSPLHEACQRFCDRCGRTRRHFFSQDEQRYHERHCRPGIYHGAHCSFCTQCGDYRWSSRLDAVRSRRCRDGESISCSHGGGDEPGRFCHQCGFDLDSLPSGGREAHRASCRGYGSEPGRFCPHCGVQFWEGHARADWHFNTYHMETCEAKNHALEPHASFAMSVEGDDDPQRCRWASSASPARLESSSTKQQLRAREQQLQPELQGRHQPVQSIDEAPPPSQAQRSRGKRKRQRRHTDDGSSYDSDTDTGSAEAQSNDEYDGSARLPRRKRRRIENDPAYQYETDVDSADDLQPDVDDLHRGADDDEEQQQQKGQEHTQPPAVHAKPYATEGLGGLKPDVNLEDGKSPAHNAASGDGLTPGVDVNPKKRKRPPQDASPKPPQEADAASGDEKLQPPPPKRAKKGAPRKQPNKKAAARKAGPAAGAGAGNASPPAKRAPPTVPAARKGADTQTDENAPPLRRSARLGTKKLS